MPAIVGKHGVETIVPIKLNQKEQEDLKASANMLKEILATI